MKIVRKRRRAENKTDYNARFVMLKGNMGRIVFRKTNRHIIGQYIKSNAAQDSIVKGTDSKALLKYGWPKAAEGSLKSTPAAYLTGLLLGKMVIEKEGKTKAMFDIGLQKNAPRSRMYAFLKGVVDSGVNINCDPAVFPDEARLLGRHMKQNIPVEKIKEKIKND